MSQVFVQVVDEKDNIINHKVRSELDLHTDIYRVAALWLTNSKGEVLLAQRSLKKDNGPGLWGPAAAGTLEEGETYESNIYKEAEEEIGLSGHKFTVGPKLFIQANRKYYAQWFKAVVDEPITYFTTQEEVEQVKWVKLSELVVDVEKEPEKYTPRFPDALKIFYKD